VQNFTFLWCVFLSEKRKCCKITYFRPKNTCHFEALKDQLHRCFQAVFNFFSLKCILMTKNPPNRGFLTFYTRWTFSRKFGVLTENCPCIPIFSSLAHTYLSNFCHFFQKKVLSDFEKPNYQDIFFIKWQTRHYRCTFHSFSPHSVMVAL
jgi:hypothetical protein